MIRGAAVRGKAVSRRRRVRVDTEVGSALTGPGATAGAPDRPRVALVIPWGLLGMLALVVSIERSAIRGNLAFSNPVGDSWSHTARLLKKGARNREVLCFGDSLVKHGLNP